MKNVILVTFLIINFVLSTTTASHCQLVIPSLSPEGTLTQVVGYTTIRVYYERPAARGRTENEIYGQLVPWGRVWRTGAGNCTKLSFTTDVTIGDKKIPKGTYSLFTIPDQKSWTIILNTDTISYGAYRYDEKKDVVRVKANPVRTSRYYESLTIDVDVIPNSARIYIAWLNTQISFDVNTGTDEKIMTFIRENLILKDSNDPVLYEKALEYYTWHVNDPKQVMKFIDRGIAIANHRRWYYYKVRELAKQKRYKEAVWAASAGIATIQNSAEEPGYDKKDLIRDFQDWIDEYSKK
jgi:hypothetical protein